MNVVYARKTAVVGSVTVRRGDVWDADAELVKRYPDLFSTLPTRVVTGSPSHAREVSTSAPVVETATRAPGETRGVGRKRSRR